MSMTTDRLEEIADRCQILKRRWLEIDPMHRSDALLEAINLVAELTKALTEKDA